MPRWNRRWLIALCSLLGAAVPAGMVRAATAVAAPQTQPSSYIRFIDRGTAGGELDTADEAFTNGHGVEVHLIAAVHVGERAYYEALAREFEGYDAVLYELVLPKDSVPPAGNGAGENSTSFIGRLQLLMKNLLDLEFQLDVIDYTKPNFVHADLDRETFDKLQADRGESLMSLMIKEALKQWSNQSTTQPADDENKEMADLIEMICRPDGDRQLKLLLAKQMDQLESQASGLDGMDGTVILTERNKAAINVLNQTLAKGKKKIAIFYGAAHMPELSQKLAGLGFTPAGTQWHMAWDMSIRADQPSLAEKFLKNLMDTGK